MKINYEFLVTFTHDCLTNGITHTDDGTPVGLMSWLVENRDRTRYGRPVDLQAKPIPGITVDDLPQFQVYRVIYRLSVSHWLYDEPLHFVVGEKIS